MRLDELKNDFPDIPDFVHDMIQEEVEKQVNSSNLTPMQRKSKLTIAVLPATYQSERDETKDYAFLSLNYNYLLKYQI